MGWSSTTVDVSHMLLSLVCVMGIHMCIKPCVFLQGQKSTKVRVKCVVRRNGWCNVQHSVVFHFQSSCKHVNVDHGVCIEGCVTGIGIANDMWLVVASMSLRFVCVPLLFTTKDTLNTCLNSVAEVDLEAMRTW